jgi:hypothetical protein
MAEIYDKAGEHLMILDIRELYFEGIEATDWTDLRVGFFVSLTDDTADDTPGPPKAETIGVEPRPLIPWTDRFAIGLTDKASGRTFCGFTNAPQGRIFDVPNIGSSKLVSSDVGIGTANTFFWRPKNEISNNYSMQIIDDGITRAISGDGSQIHFVQETVGAGGYCTLIALRFTRPDAFGRAKIITMSTKKATGGGHSADILFNSDPSDAILETNLNSFPTDVQTLGPIEMSQVPDTLYVYWPFRGSRLRIHNYGILKVA